MRTIRVSLDPKGIDMAIKEINAYRKEVEQKAVRLAQRLTDKGVEIARMKIVEMCKISSGDLLSSVIGYYSPALNSGFVRVTNDHAIFVEFGTGPQGAAHPHPMGGIAHKGEGWYTKADGKPMDNLYNWTPITTKNGDVIYYTEGQPAKPFMYETARELSIEYLAIAKEVFAQ